MSWREAIQQVLNNYHAYDVTYEEWCELYYNHDKPPSEQQSTIREAVLTAGAVLRRNNVITEDTEFTGYANGEWI